MDTGMFAISDIQGWHFRNILMQTQKIRETTDAIMR
jgi:hypothetical protein